MTKIINKGKCALKLGTIFLIPNQTVEIDMAAVKKDFPQITKLIEEKTIVELTKAESKK